MAKHDPEAFYRYPTDMYVCGECLDRDLDETANGNLVGDEMVYQGMFTRLPDGNSEDFAYQCDSCGKQNAAYELIGEEP